jgi:hypothetical protein
MSLRAPLVRLHTLLYLCTMRLLKPIVSLYMALLIGITSMGIAVSAHACAASGFSETSLGHLKACCKLADGHGFRAEPCCKVRVQHVKLATVRTAATAQNLQHFAPIPPIWIATYAQLHAGWLAQHRPKFPPESPPILPSCDALTLHCTLLI